MAVVPRKRKHQIVYYVAFTYQGRKVWERAGTDRQEAERLDARRKREVKRGSYERTGAGPSTTFRTYALEWLSHRTNRTADNDRALVTRHVLDRESRAWFVRMPLGDIRPRDVLRLIGQLQREPRDAADPKSKPLAPKSVAYICGVLRPILKHAHVHEAIPRDPWAVPKGTIKRRVSKPRIPYALAETTAILRAELAADALMFAALAFYTGAREGEICGLRFRSWDRDAAPLGCLEIDSQYDGQALKTDSDDRVRPRKVPVHPDLARLLTWWAGEGFEYIHCRKPRPDDALVPHRGGAPHTKSSAYKLWRRICDGAGVANRSLHSTRHTFITQARRGGARPDVLERVTHNAAGAMIDQYTHWEWEPLCDAVACARLVDANVDARANPAPLQLQRLDSKERDRASIGIDPRQPMRIGGPGGVQNRSRIAASATKRAASQPGRLLDARIADELLGVALGRLAHRIAANITSSHAP